jgi:hypothetical protein
MSMTRIHQQVTSRQHKRSYQFGSPCVRQAMHAACVMAVLAFFAASATAQSTSLLNGSVTDPTGAAVRDAKITLTDPATGSQRTTTSNAAGLYQFLDVPPGDYRLEATAAGFAPYVASNVTLQVKLPSTVPIRLQVAGATTSVNVEGEAPLINRTDASLGNVVAGSQIDELPIAQRNVVQLLSLQPGVAYLGNELNADTDTRSGAVNGLRSDQSNVTLDGIGVNDQNNGYAFQSVLNVPPDSVEEFRVTTANANADSGYSSGAQVALVTKSGTNNFHGSAYEYNRNTIFSANDPFIKDSQLSSGQSNTAPKLLYNVFGAAVGGPIKKNRLFFFANYEGFRQAKGSSALRTVPSAALAAGNLQYLCTLNKDGSLDTTDCPGGTVNGVSGVALGYYGLGPAQIKGMDPLGIGPNAAVEAVLNQYPGSNENSGDGLNTLGYRFASNADSTWNTYILKGDWHINSSGSETLFLRGQTQNQNNPQQQQFPGQPASTTLVDDSRGITVGLTSLINPRLVNDFHWGYIRQGGQNAGTSFNPGIFLSGLSDLTPFTRSTIYFVPTNEFGDNLNWSRGNHTVQFGGDLLLIRNNHTSYANSFSDVQTNPVYLNTGGIANTPSPLDPANNINPATNKPYPSVDLSFGPNYDAAAGILLGIFAEGDGIYNFARDGTALAQGTPINRRYAVNNYEFFGQDTWRMTPRLTLTYGLRWVLEAPPYETNGLQVAPCVEATGGGCTNQNVADWFNHTAQLASQGQSANSAGEISFVLGGPKNHGPGLWNWDRKDFSPRIAVAWAPDTGDGWVSKIFGKKDQFSIRAGYSITYDHFGIPIVNSFDQHGSLGVSTDLGNPAGVVTVAGAPRFTCLTPGSSGQSCLPAPCPTLSGPSCLFGPAPAGGFPYTPSNSNFAINWGLDQTLKTPYAHVFNFSLSRQLTPHSSLQVAYVGSIGRRLPMQVDLAMPANLTDPSSKTTYFQAATMLSKAAAPTSALPNGTDVNSIQPIPFFENIFPAWAGTTTQSNLGAGCAAGTPPTKPTATQNIYELWTCYPHNETFSLFLMDLPGAVTGMTTPNSKNGPYTFFHDQFSSLYAWRNIGTSAYNALQVTYQVRLNANLQGQFNYTFSKSFDEASAAERVGPYEGTGGTGSDLNGGGIVINSWDPLSLRGLSDFNAFHQINANLVYRLPFGKGQKFAENAGRVLNALIGGWHASGVFRWTSGFPITIDNGFTWATNWNIEGDAEPNGAPPVASNPKNAIVNGVGIGPDIFQHPDLAEAAFRPEWPGESGVRNNVIGDGMFNIDTGLSKDFSLGEQRRMEFTWQTFNATNSVRYDVRAAQPSLSFDASEFGKYTSTLTTPRFMQFALRFVF